MAMSGLRQTSTMRSTKLLVLEAIRRHFSAYGCAPSYGELHAAIGVEPPRISAIMRELGADGLIVHRPGMPRGVVLPRPLANFSTSELMLELQARGLITKLMPALSPMSVVASELAAGLVHDVASGTIEQLSENAVLDHLLHELEVADSGEAGGQEQAGDERGHGRESHPQSGSQEARDSHGTDGPAGSAASQ